MNLEETSSSSQVPMLYIFVKDIIDNQQIIPFKIIYILLSITNRVFNIIFIIIV